MNIRIIKPGIADSIQDLGRKGSQYLGIGPGGAMDKYAATIANALVGNSANSALLEMHFPAAAIFFDAPALIAISGADFDAHVNGEPVQNNHPILLNKFSILQFQKSKSGARVYLAVNGGISSDSWLNSNSTNIKVGVGGFKGRYLQKDDEIACSPLAEDIIARLGKKEFQILPWQADLSKAVEEQKTLLVLKGQEFTRLDENSQKLFWNTGFTLSSKSDRMGYNLSGPGLITNNKEELISAPVQFGTIQLLPNGQLMMLMADHQTTGGYPKLAHIVSADHSLAAQFKSGDAFKLRECTQSEAEDLIRKQQQHLLQVQNACTFRLEEFFQ